jgi:hypothetical protein
MKKAIADKWVKALRSGEYKQVQKRLAAYTDKTKTEVGFCCLGVLTDLYAKEKNFGRKDYQHLFNFDEDTDECIMSVLPYAVRVWADMDTAVGMFIKENNRVLDLAILNDDWNVDFDGIANTIERNYEQL